MNNVRRQPCAKAYEHDFNLTGQSDIYLYSRTTSRVIQDGGSGGRGSSTHTSSSGRTHGGGGGKF